MSTNTLDILTRSLVGAAGRGNNRNRKKKQKKKNKQNDTRIFARCVSQVPACETLAVTGCGANAGCQFAVKACCQSLATCEFTEFITCANAAFSPA
ncbi:MAG: hypothetical protein KC442_09170 [Thermomicrobiales bacterium]|nr:hypothetical protein [Thermomicrobiales bacterium]